jgi:hypothetical protein
MSIGVLVDVNQSAVLPGIRISLLRFLDMLTLFPCSRRIPQSNIQRRCTRTLVPAQGDRMYCGRNHMGSL